MGISVFAIHVGTIEDFSPDTFVFSELSVSGVLCKLMTVKGPSTRASTCVQYTQLPTCCGDQQHTCVCTHAFQLCSHIPDSILTNLFHPVFCILFCAGLIEVLMHMLSEAAVVYMDEEKRGAMKVSHLVLQALLELLHTILQETVVVCSPLQVRARINDKGADCSSS